MRSRTSGAGAVLKLPGRAAAECHWCDQSGFNMRALPPTRRGCDGGSATHALGHHEPDSSYPLVIGFTLALRVAAAGLHV